jgi:hypothetical protein
MLKRAVGAELADFHKSCTMIAPPFYNAMIDIAIRFKARATKDLLHGQRFSDRVPAHFHHVHPRHRGSYHPVCGDVIGWEMLFAKISNHVDNFPIARGSASAAHNLGWEIITPNGLKLGHNNFRQLDGDIQLAGGPQNMLECNRALSEKWYNLFIDSILLLIPKPE